MDESPDPPPQPLPYDPHKITALEFFYPELAEGERRTLDHETFIIADRRRLVAELMHRRFSVREIARQVKMSESTVRTDMEVLIENWKRIAAADMASHMAHSLQKLDAREADLEREWEKSKGEQVEATITKRGAVSNSTLKKKQRCGDPRYMELILKVMDRRFQLLGLLKASELAPKQETPPAKLVAGLDPIEAV
jgi:lambda repressor-like predicted transcriptional regulator